MLPANRGCFHSAPSEAASTTNDRSHARDAESQLWAGSGRLVPVANMSTTQWDRASLGRTGVHDGFCAGDHRGADRIVPIESLSNRD